MLVIPCHQNENEVDGHQKKQPLLVGRLASLRRHQHDTGSTDKPVGDVGIVGDTTGAVDEDKGAGMSMDTLDDETVMNQLIQSADQSNLNTLHDLGYSTIASNSTSGRGGLVISAPSQNKLSTARRNIDNVVVKADDEIKQDDMMMNDDELFKRELSHHAADVDPTSNVYANVAIHDFGSALLRGMGWTGGSESLNMGSKGDETQAVKPRPHRLGLGATPHFPLPSSSGDRGSSGRSSNANGAMIHRRARRPEEVKRDEDRLRQQEEAEKREEEKKRLDVQNTMQKGSIVHIINRDCDVMGSQDGDSSKDRALVIRTAGVPGLNRILIQKEGSTIELSVPKQSALLCSWEELKTKPYQRIPLQSCKDEKPRIIREKETNNEPAVAQKSDRRMQMRDDDMKVGDKRSDAHACGYSRDNTHQSFSEEDKRRKRHHHDHDQGYHRRTRSRSNSREYTGKRRKETSSLRKHIDDDEFNYRSRSSVKEDNSSSHKRKQQNDSRSSHQRQQDLHWLIPNIRVRLISKKIPKYYLQKGVVQDVHLSSSRDSGGGGNPKAILLMDNGQVLDKVPERYLETALPQPGGNVIILEGKENLRWKMGRLLERSSKDGRGIIQLEEDLDVVNVSLDSIAEWCGEERSWTAPLR